MKIFINIENENLNRESSNLVTYQMWLLKSYQYKAYLVAEEKAGNVNNGS